jgi:hypothetical protein
VRTSGSKKTRPPFPKNKTVTFFLASDLPYCQTTLEPLMHCTFVFFLQRNETNGSGKQSSQDAVDGDGSGAARLDRGRGGAGGGGRGAGRRLRRRRLGRGGGGGCRAAGSAGSGGRALARWRRLAPGARAGRAARWAP